MSDPTHYAELILVRCLLDWFLLILTKQFGDFQAPRLREYSKKRGEDWNDKGARGLRSEMKQRTEQLSQQWMKSRASKDGQKTQDAAGNSKASSDPPASSTKDDSDSDVVIEDVVATDTQQQETSVPPRISRRKVAESAAERKSGKAMRLR